MAKPKSSISDSILSIGLPIFLQPDEDQPEKLVRTAINLTELAQDGRIHHCDVEGSYEAELFVHLILQR